MLGFGCAKGLQGGRGGKVGSWVGREMESYLNENFGGVKSKNSSEDALRRWRRLCGVVKNPKRRFRFTANLSKRSEAAAMKRTNQVIFYLYIYIYVCI